MAKVELKLTDDQLTILKYKLIQVKEERFNKVVHNFRRHGQFAEAWKEYGSELAGLPSGLVPESELEDLERQTRLLKAAVEGRLAFADGHAEVVQDQLKNVRDQLDGLRKQEADLMRRLANINFVRGCL